MCVGVVSIWIYPSKCGNLNVISFVSISALKIIALRISSSNNVVVPIINKSGFITKSISSSLYVTPFVRS